jgi:hypothetical protein
MSNQAPRQDEREDRRAFLRGAARKAVYVAPAVILLTRRSTMAGVSCLPNNSPCVDNADCCSGNCETMMNGSMWCRT